MKPSESAVDTFYECDAIKHLSTAAVVILVGLFKKAHPNLIPVSASSKDKLRTRLSKQVLVCPDHAIVLFCRDPSTNFRELMAQHQKLLTEAADVTAQHPTFIANVRPVFVNIFASITIASSECKSIMCYWHIKDENRLILNQSYIQNMSDDLIIEEIACGIMPKISASSAAIFSSVCRCSASTAAAATAAAAGSKEKDGSQRSASQKERARVVQL
jgi:hypothetical protein